MDETKIRPYGDTFDDGMIQMSFTLPVPYGARAIKAAELYVKSLRFNKVSVSHAREIAERHTFFIVYAGDGPALDFTQVTAAEVTSDIMTFAQINEAIRDQIGHRLIVVGATIGSDAHTVGIDAILNPKGYNQDYGLERYPQIEAHNLGAQVSCETLIQRAVEINAHAVLVSQTVTQKDAHIRNFTELVELLEAENIREKFVLVAGGPRISHQFALELGYDAGFGAGTQPSQVAAFIVQRLVHRLGKDKP